MRATDEHDKVAFWTVINDHFAKNEKKKYVRNLQRTFWIEKNNTTFHQANTGNHECRKKNSNVVASFLHLMVLFCKAVINHIYTFPKSETF